MSAETQVLGDALLLLVGFGGGYLVAVLRHLGRELKKKPDSHWNDKV